MLVQIEELAASGSIGPDEAVLRGRRRPWDISERARGEREVGGARRTVAPDGRDDRGADRHTGSGLHARALTARRPGEPPALLSIEGFRASWSGELVLMTSQANFVGELAKFDFSWFIPAIVKYRRLLGEILLISLTLQLIGLVTPMFFQVVMDKVLVNHAMKTLNVIAIGGTCAASPRPMIVLNAQNSGVNVRSR